MGQFPIHITDTTFSVYVGGKPYQTDRSNPNWEAIKTLVDDPNATGDQLINLIKPIGAIASALQGVVDVRVYAGEVLVNGEPIRSGLATRVLDIFAQGMSIDSWVAFIQNAFANPFIGARDELYDFMEGSDMPLTPDGCFLAYKIVAEDYTDLYTAVNGRGGRFSNRVGEVVSMPRELVDTNRRNTCSTGLHFCSRAYLPSYGTGYGSRVMIVKINPADVVSIPVDYNHAKGRTWRYEVVGELSREEAGLHTWGPVDSTWDAPEADEETAETPDGLAAVATKEYGVLTIVDLLEVKANNGDTWAGVARHYEAAPGTVSGWVKSLRKQGADI